MAEVPYCLVGDYPQRMVGEHETLWVAGYSAGMGAHCMCFGKDQVVTLWQYKSTLPEVEVVVVEEVMVEVGVVVVEEVEVVVEEAEEVVAVVVEVVGLHNKQVSTQEHKQLDSPQHRLVPSSSFLPLQVKRWKKSRIASFSQILLLVKRQTYQ